MSIEGMFPDPEPGLIRISCECGGYSDINSEDEIEVAVHQESCGYALDLEDQCEAHRTAEDTGEPESLTDESFVLALRLMISAAEGDDDAVNVTLEDFPDCGDCRLAVWFSVLRILQDHVSEDFADHLRADLLELLDEIDERSEPSA